jgi:hypothetical protein
MRTFRGTGKDAEELRKARQEIENLQGALKAAQAVAGAKDREIRELKAQVRRLEIRVAEMKTGGAFVESHGVLWQRSAGGRIDPLAYCPTCKLVMTPLPSGYPEYFICTHCKFKAPFHPEDIPRIMGELAD